MNRRRVIVNVAASEKGAVTILEKTYQDALISRDCDILFLVSVVPLVSQSHVQVRSFPWVKKHWLLRLFFDRYIAPKVIKEFAADEVLSQQNTYIPRLKGIPQTIYVHQSLPFSEIRFKPWQSFKLWRYQTLVGTQIKRSIKRAQNIIVQSQWMKDAISSRKLIEPSRITVEPPKLYLPVAPKHKLTVPLILFYPSGNGLYKNHSVLIEAMKKLRDVHSSIHLVFTLKGDEDKHVSALFKEVQTHSLPVSFIGHLSQGEVYHYYQSSLLVFPSVLETMGLPLKEAMHFGTPILASNMAYAQEQLKDYTKADLIEPYQSEIWANIIRKYIDYKE